MTTMKLSLGGAEAMVKVRSVKERESIGVRVDLFAGGVSPDDGVGKVIDKFCGETARIQRQVFEDEFQKAMSRMDETFAAMHTCTCPLCGNRHSKNYE